MDGSHGVTTLARMNSIARLALVVVPFLAACASDRASSAPPGSWLAVLDKEDATLRVIEPNTGSVKDVHATGVGPHECAASPDGELLVVCNYGDAKDHGGTLTVWDLVERRVRATIDLAPHQRPHGIRFLSRRHALVTSETSHALLEVDLAREKVVRTIDTGAKGSHMVAVALAQHRAYTANVGSGSISVLDLERGKLVQEIPTGNQPEGIDVSPDGNEVWIGHNADDKLVVLDARTLEKKDEIACGKLPIRVACTWDGKYVLVSCAMSGEVAMFDRASRREIARIAMPKLAQPAQQVPPGADPLSPVPVGIVVESRSRFAYVALNAADQVAVIDLAKRAVVRTFATGRGPDGMAWIWRREPPEMLGDRERRS